MGKRKAPAAEGRAVRRTARGEAGSRSVSQMQQGTTPKRPSMRDFAEEDLILSQQVDPDTGIGWDCQSPDALRHMRFTSQNSCRDADVTDLVKHLDKEVDGLLEATPPLLGVWLKANQDVDVDPKENPPDRQTRKIRTRRKAHGRLGGKRPSALSKDLMDKLTNLMDIQQKEEQGGSPILKPTPRKSIRLSEQPQRAVAVTASQHSVISISDDDASQKLASVDHTNKVTVINMNTKKATSPNSRDTHLRKSAQPECGNANLKKSSKAEGAKKTAEAEHSLDENDLWDDDDDLFNDDSLLRKATQLSQDLFATPKTSKAKGVTTSTPKNDGHAPKVGRFTFSLDGPSATGTKPCDKQAAGSNPLNKPLQKPSLQQGGNVIANKPGNGLGNVQRQGVDSSTSGNVMIANTNPSAKAAHTNQTWNNNKGTGAVVGGAQRNVSIGREAEPSQSQPSMSQSGNNRSLRRIQSFPAPKASQGPANNNTSSAVNSWNKNNRPSGRGVIIGKPYDRPKPAVTIGKPTTMPRTVQSQKTMIGNSQATTNGAYKSQAPVSRGVVITKPVQNTMAHSIAVTKPVNKAHLGSRTLPPGGTVAKLQAVPPGGLGNKVQTVPPGGTGNKLQTVPPGGSGNKLQTVPPGGSGAKLQTVPPGRLGTKPQTVPPICSGTKLQKVPPGVSGNTLQTIPPGGSLSKPTVSGVKNNNNVTDDEWKDTSLSDDILCLLAEPDEILDSQSVVSSGSDKSEKSCASTVILKSSGGSSSSSSTASNRMMEVSNTRSYKPQSNAKPGQQNNIGQKFALKRIPPLSHSAPKTTNTAPNGVSLGSLKNKSTAPAPAAIQTTKPTSSGSVPTKATGIAAKGPVQNVKNEAARSEEAAFMSDDDTLSELQVMAMLDEVESQYSQAPSSQKCSASEIEKKKQEALKKKQESLKKKNQHLQASNSKPTAVKKFSYKS